MGQVPPGSGAMGSAPNGNTHVPVTLQYFTTSPYTAMQPTLPELLRLKVPERVGTKYQEFGIFLLNDTTGSKVESLKHQHMGDPSRITMGILQEWLEGRGLPVSWGTLIQTLRDIQLNLLAEEVAAAHQ